MKPKYFLVTTCDNNISACCEDRSIRLAGTISEEYRGPLSFSVSQDGSPWHDTIAIAWIGLSLFSERVKNAFESNQIKGMSFFEANIVSVYDPTSDCGPRPNYFWGRAEGIIQFDALTFQRFERSVPTNVSPITDNEVFHRRNSSNALAGYYCTFRVIEVLRNAKITNLFVRPVDYYEEKKRNVFIPPFHIDLTAEQWPPVAWYPEGFVPHPNNLE